MVGPSAGPASTTTRRAPGGRPGRSAADWPDRARGLRRDGASFLGTDPRAHPAIVADNLSAHKVAGVRHDRARRRHLCYLPPYSPDLNPIEPASRSSKPSCAPPAVDALCPSAPVCRTSGGMPQLLSTLRLSGHHTVMKSALEEPRSVPGGKRRSRSRFPGRIQTTPRRRAS